MAWERSLISARKAFIVLVYGHDASRPTHSNSQIGNKTKPVNVRPVFMGQRHSRARISRLRHASRCTLAQPLCFRTVRVRLTDSDRGPVRPADLQSTRTGCQPTPSLLLHDTYRDKPTKRLVNVRRTRLVVDSIDYFSRHGPPVLRSTFSLPTSPPPSRKNR